jgi:leukotriene-A4 hydrolase
VRCSLLLRLEQAADGLHAEQTLGGLDVFLPYVKDYVNTYIGTSITTQQWKSHLYSYFKKSGGAEKIALLDSVNWDVSYL